MIDLIPDILNQINEIEFPLDVDIVEGYPPKKPDFAKPLIAVREVQNTVDQTTYTTREEYSNITIEVEIYSRTQKINNIPMTAPRVCSLLRDLIDEKLSSTLCLFRVGTPYTQPSLFDNTVTRNVITYEVTVDSTYKICYRGL